MRESKFMAKARASGLLGTLQGLIDFVYERAHTACNNKELACPRGGCDACALSDIKELTESTTTYKKTTINKQVVKAFASAPCRTRRGPQETVSTDQGTTTYKKTAIVKQVVPTKDLPVIAAAPAEVIGEVKIYNKKRKR